MTIDNHAQSSRIEAPTDQPTHSASLTWPSTPLGPMVALCSDHGVLQLQWLDQSWRRITSGLMSFDITEEPNAISWQLHEELQGYFSGQLRHFTVPCHLNGTAFQQHAWQALRSIPYGTTISYADQAAQIDRPQACRAVARANASNRIAMIIPCHRVINRQGGLSGYAAGIERKQWLLEHEQKHR